MSRINEVAEQVHRLGASFILADGSINTAIHVEMERQALDRILSVIIEALSLLDYEIKASQSAPQANRERLAAVQQERSELDGVRNLIDTALKRAQLRPRFFIEIRPEKVEPLMRAIGQGMVRLRDDEGLKEEKDILSMSALLEFVDSFARGARKCQGCQIRNENLQQLFNAKNDLLPLVERVLFTRQHGSP